MESNNIDKKETIFTTPTVCGCYSITGRNYIFSADASRLRYWNKYCPQQGSVEINLNDRPRDHIGRDPKNHPKLLNNLLKYIMADKKRFTDVLKDDAIALQESPVVCSRRCLKVISSLPYFLKDPNTIHCCLYRGVIYFYDLPKSEDRAPDDAGANWGHKFEQYMLADSPVSRPKTSGTVIHDEHFSLIFRANLNNHRLIYTAEVDGVIVEDDNTFFSNISGDDLISKLDKSKFIELKTKNELNTSFYQYTFRKYNTIQWWLHSLFGRNNILLCGFKNKDTGMVKDIEKYNVNSLPNDSGGFWNPETCLNSANMFLSYMKSCLSDELNKLNIDEQNIRSAPKIEIMFKRESNSNIFKKCEKYPEDFSLLPQWYIESFDNIQ